jgi:hypothetical protein
LWQLDWRSGLQDSSSQRRTLVPHAKPAMAQLYPADLPSSL